MIFGVFDGLHPGHEYFIGKALHECEQLIVVVAQDSVALELKGRTPKFTELERQATVKKLYPKTQVVFGDSTMSSWKVLDEHRPDIVFLGYDQQGIEKALEKRNIAFTYIDSHEPKKYKSSLLYG